MATTLRLDEIVRARNSLHFAFSIADLRFSTACWYDTVDFGDLEARFGSRFLDGLCFHIAAFEINKLASLRPDAIDLSAGAVHQTPEFEALWRTVFKNVWAQWRYENDLPEYFGPAFTAVGHTEAASAVAVDAGESAALSFCGGGKDSLVAMKLLERGGHAFDSLTYSSSIYGGAAHQHELIATLLDHGAARNHRRQWIYEDFLDSPVLALRPDFGARTLTAAETPSSIFAALPLVLQHGYRYLVLGHERSADAGQVFWEKTGEDVNHQWGKSFEAETLLNTYVRKHFVRDLSFFSILKPVYDLVIFSMLRRDLDAVPATHSCNVRKPWCLRCPKCAYVWLGYRAFLPEETVHATFGAENLFDFEENQFTYRQLLGLEEQLPFECIGEQGETRLLFEMCRRRGFTGRALDVFVEQVGPLDLDALLERYLSLDWSHSGLPADIDASVRPQIEAAAREARDFISTL